MLDETDLSSTLDVTLMSILSPLYFVVAGLAAVVLRLLPSRLRPVFLTLLSFWFYWTLEGSSAMALVIMALAAYGTGILYDQSSNFFRVAQVVTIGGAVASIFAARIVTVGSIGVLTAGSTLVLPLSFSYYVFQVIGYTVDVGRGRTKIEKSPARLFSYVAFMPHLVAGPVMDTRRVLPQFSAALHATKADIAPAVELILIGLFKKVVLADPVHEMLLETEFSLAGPKATNFLLLPIIGFMDASGYLDIARGVALLFGIRLPQAFAQPLTRSRNMAEFWRRWNIPLMSFFRNYLFVPVKGFLEKRAKLSAVRTLVALMVVFAVTGLWHGIALPWILWAVVTVVMLALDARVREQISRRKRQYRRKRSRSGTIDLLRFARRGLALSYIFIVIPLLAYTFLSDWDPGRTNVVVPFSTLIWITVIEVIGLVVIDRYEFNRERRGLHKAVVPTPTRGIAWGIGFATILVFSTDVAHPFIYQGF